MTYYDDEWLAETLENEYQSSMNYDDYEPSPEEMYQRTLERRQEEGYFGSDWEE